MKFILGTKKGMTQIFDEKGNVSPATIIEAGPLLVTAVKTLEKDGYSAIQVGYGTKREKLVSKPELGAMGKLGVFRYMKEFRLSPEEVSAFKVGDSINLSAFLAGDTITASSVSKGKGFQGVVKRHHFGGGRRSHGQKHSEREPGTISGSGGRAGGRVAKDIRMAGRMGGDRVTMKNLTVAAVNVETNTIAIKGSLPGRKGIMVELIVA